MSSIIESKRLSVLIGTSKIQLPSISNRSWLVWLMLVSCQYISSTYILPLLVCLTGLSNLLFLFFIKLDKTSVLIFSKLISESLLLLSSHWLSSDSIFILFRPRNSTSSREDSTTFVIITSSSGSVSICSGTSSVSSESFPVSVDSAGITTSN